MVGIEKEGGKGETLVWQIRHSQYQSRKVVWSVGGMHHLALAW